MDDVRIELRVDRDGRMRATRRDTDESGPTFQMVSAGLDAEIIRLFQRWLVLRDRKWSEDEIRLFGSLLHRFMFGEGDCWRWVDGVIRQVNTGIVHLELVFPADGAFAALAAIPWEYLYRPEYQMRSGSHLAADKRLVLSRYIPSEGGEPPVPKKDNLQVLVVVSRPAQLDPVVYTDVLAEIERTVADHNWSQRLLDTPTATELHNHLRENEAPDLVHFMGHGRFDPERGVASLALVDDSGETEWVPDRALAEIITRNGTPPRAVVLHACEAGRADYLLGFAGVAPQLVRSGVPNVVAMQYAVTNDTAIKFSQCLYQQIARGIDLDVAVQEARWHISRLGDQPDPRLIGVPLVYRQSAGALFGLDERQ
jgi:hypothetical protein